MSDQTLKVVIEIKEVFLISSGITKSRGKKKIPKVVIALIQSLHHVPNDITKFFSQLDTSEMNQSLENSFQTNVSKIGKRLITSRILDQKEDDVNNSMISGMKNRNLD